MKNKRLKVLSVLGVGILFGVVINAFISDKKPKKYMDDYYYLVEDNFEEIVNS